jgi:beta-galactosidase GanA
MNMQKLLKSMLFVVIFSILTAACSQNEKEKANQTQLNSHQIPHLKKQGKTAQLIVEDKPYLILGGELGNSSFTSLEYMEPIWPKLEAMNLNTVLVPIYWELMEPSEGNFDFKLYDKLIEKARNHDLKLIPLWFGSWKNSMSCYAPSWVKKDQQRFPRIKDDKGISHEILTPFSENNLNADLKAYQALLKHVREIDENEHTIIMMQCENEIGMLPTARDYHPLANKKFQESVPAEFIQYLKKNKENLVPEFKAIWEKNGYKESGTWEEIFGEGPHTDEIFMAWYYARFTNAIVEAGKEIYPLPMYVNGALNRPGWLPGKYPSAGPLPHLMDVWKAGGPSIDFFSPDLYFPNIKHWSDLYTRQGNPLFIPEHRFDHTIAAKAAFVFGHYEAMGFSPFSIESTRDPDNEPIGKIYNSINQLTPIITANQGQNKIDGVLLDKENQGSNLRFGDYEFTVKHSYTLGYEANSKNDVWEETGALILQTGENEFYLAGSGVVITFKNLKNPELNVGILKAEQGRFENAEWKVIRYLNGDQTHQGRHIRILFNDGFFIQRFELYKYE